MARLQSRFVRIATVAGLSTALVGGGLIATGAAGALASEAAPSLGAHLETIALARQAGIHWTATSPTTHQGDQYQLVITNGATAQHLVVRTQIMDHHNHKNTVVIQEQLQLAPGEQRILTATNN